jgi:hypothetical protein
MNVYESEARLYFARERADLLAKEMQATRRAPKPEANASRPGTSTGLLARLRQARLPLHRRAAAEI